MGGIDLHIHSTASDGDTSPADLAGRAKAAGLGVIAITDHDTLAGVPTARAAAGSDGVTVIAGCEFSVAAPWGEMHVLGLFLDASCWSLSTLLEDSRAARRGRAIEMIDKLQGLGVAVQSDAVLLSVGNGTIGRPHIGRWLVRLGAARDLDDAFQRFIGEGKPAYVPKPLPGLGKITCAIHEAGGIAVAAHLGWRGTEDLVLDLRDEGVDALEIRHPGHSRRMEAKLAGLAQRLGLGLSGGSDWHGESGGKSGHAALGSITIPKEWLHDLAHRASRASPTGWKFGQG